MAIPEYRIFPEQKFFAITVFVLPLLVAMTGQIVWLGSVFILYIVSLLQPYMQEITAFLPPQIDFILLCLGLLLINIQFAGLALAASVLGYILYLPTACISALLLWFLPTPVRLAYVIMLPIIQLCLFVMLDASDPILRADDLTLYAAIGYLNVVIGLRLFCYGKEKGYIIPDKREKSTI